MKSRKKLNITCWWSCWAKNCWTDGLRGEYPLPRPALVAKCSCFISGTEAALPCCNALHSWSILMLADLSPCKKSVGVGKLLGSGGVTCLAAGPGLASFVALYKCSLWLLGWCHLPWSMGWTIAMGFFNTFCSLSPLSFFLPWVMLISAVIGTCKQD